MIHVIAWKIETAASLKRAMTRLVNSGDAELAVNVGDADEPILGVPELVRANARLHNGMYELELRGPIPVLLVRESTKLKKATGSEILQQLDALESSDDLPVLLSASNLAPFTFVPARRGWAMQRI